MEINEVSFNGQPPVDSYGPGFFRVSNIIHKGALFLTLKGSIDWTGLDDLAAIIENNHIYFGSKPVHWCIESESALAEAEPTAAQKSIILVTCSKEGLL